MKKISLLLAAILLITTVFCGCSDKETAKIKESSKVENILSDSNGNFSSKIQESPITDFRYETHEGGITITQFIGTSKDVIIPEKINNLPVERIQHSSFTGSEIVSVVIPDTVTEIGYFAFQNCQKLEKVVLSKNIEIIPMDCFKSCYSLKTIELHRGIKIFESECFMNCESLESIKFPNTIEIWGYQTFASCGNLKNIEFEEGLKEISGSGAFGGSNSLEKLTIPASVEEINKSPFMGCPKLKTIVFEGDAPEIREGTKPFGVHDKSKKIYYDKNTSGWEDTSLKEWYTLVPQ